MEKRHLVLAARCLAAAGALTLRGRSRAAAWAAHDFFWLYPTLRRNCDWHGEVVTRFETTEPAVWLTIDDGPDSHDTPAMLDVLRDRGVRASFFAIGKNAARHPDLCRRIVAEGHTLENHTQTHPAGAWWIWPAFLVGREIALAQHVLTAAGGRAPRFFRSPVGMSNRSVHPEAARAGLRVIGWSAAGGDGCPAAPSTVARRILRAVRPGSIILLHEGGGSRHRVLTLVRLLDHLAAAGFHCVLPAEDTLRGA
jgi:peptidoglycan/xylan/chitin deacetylase (PgdA/CDA1 family)